MTSKRPPWTTALALALLAGTMLFGGFLLQANAQQNCDSPEGQLAQATEPSAAQACANAAVGAALLLHGAAGVAAVSIAYAAIAQYLRWRAEHPRPRREALPEQGVRLRNAVGFGLRNAGIAFLVPLVLFGGWFLLDATFLGLLVLVAVLPLILVFVPMAVFAISYLWAREERSRALAQRALGPPSPPRACPRCAATLAAQAAYCMACGTRAAGPS